MILHGVCCPPAESEGGLPPDAVPVHILFSFLCTIPQLLDDINVQTSNLIMFSLSVDFVMEWAE